MTDSNQVRLRSSHAPPGRPRGPLRRLVELLLYPVFQLLLVIPAVRRWRRAAWWTHFRLAAAVPGLALLAFGSMRLMLAGGFLLLLAGWLAPVPDPDRLRKIAAQLGAPHPLNGGSCLSGLPGLRPGAPVLLFVSGREALLAAARRPDQVVARYPIADLETIAIDGEIYQPRYISFAKEPPRLEVNPDRRAVRRLALHFGPQVLELEYSGMFAGHLAEVAAHTLYDLRRLRQAEGCRADTLNVLP